MKRKVILSALVLALLLASLATALAVMAAKKPAPPRTLTHDAGCLSYCARSIMYEDFDGDGVWKEWDVDKDGKVEICLLEGMEGVGEYMQCHKLGEGMCPEFANTPGGPLDRCQLLSDFDEGGRLHDSPALPPEKGGMRFACVVQNGADTHNVTH